MILTLILHLLCINPVISRLDPITKDLLTPITEFGEGCGYMSCPQTMDGVLNIHIVPSTHGELGYTRTFYEHYTGNHDFYDHTKVNMKNILDAVITSLWTRDGRKFTISDMPYFFYWWKNRDGTVRRMVYQLLRQGRLYFVGGGWSMSDEATTSYHAIIEHFTYSLRKINATFLECGRPLVTWQSDVYGHSREFASLMAQMGFDGHFINPISYEDELARMKSKSLEFLWRGSDDLGASTDIYTHKLFDGYWSPPGFCFGGFCNDPIIITADATFSNVDERVNEFMKHMTERQGPYYTTRNVMVMMGQRLGYHDAELWFTNIDKLIGAVNARQSRFKNKVQLFYSTPACYLKAVHDASPMLSTKQDDFFPFTYDKDTHTSGMYTSRPHIKYMAREVLHFLQICKQLQIFAKLGNNDKRFEDIMWIAGVIQDHTIITGAMRIYVSEYYARKVHLAKEISLQMIRPAFNKLRHSPKAMIYYACPLNISSCWTLEGDRFYIVVYNPLAWSVTVPVRLPIARGLYHVFDPEGEMVNHSIISIPDIVVSIPNRGEFITEDELVFIANKIPPMGFKSFYVDQVHVRAKRSIIKKLNKTKQKKYLTRQTNNVKQHENKKQDETINKNKGETKIINKDTKRLAEDSPPEYEYFEDTTTIVVKMETTKSKEKAEMEEGVEEIAVTEPLQNIIKPKEISIDVYTDYELTPKSVDGDVSELEGIEPPVTITRTSTSSTISRTTTKTTKPATTHHVPKTVVTTTPKPEYYDDVPDNSKTKAPNFDYDKYYRRMEQSGYLSVDTSENFIKNEYITINLNDQEKLSSIKLSNGVNISFDIQLCYYMSDDPVKLGSDRKKPGAYIFRPLDQQPILIAQNIETRIIKTDIVEEIQIRYTTWAGVAIKLYKGLPTIEIDWVVGPIPIEDGYGKDVFIRYSTNVINNGVFYTDSNGRQTIKRIRDMRPTYRPINIDNVAGNFYPVTSKIYIEDLKRNIRLSVFTDRAEGGTCLIDGNVDLMVHRRILTDDSGSQSYLNETEAGKGLIIRGKHHVYISKADFRPNKVFEKKFAKELEMGPRIFTSIHPSFFNMSYDDWMMDTNEYSALKTKVPVGIHILTIEKWNDNKLLLRLENYLEKSDIVRSGYKTVFIKNLFKDFVILDAKETTLGANIWMENYLQVQWQKEQFVNNFNDVYGNVSNLKFTDERGLPNAFEKVNINKGITLGPLQIRTFVITVSYRT